MMKPWSGIGVGASLLCGALAWSLPAAAQDIASAETLFNRGLAEMEAGHYEIGCKAIAESQRLDPRAGTLFTLATCEARWGHTATAVTRYGDYLTVYERLPEERRAGQGDRPKVARAERDRLGPEVPLLTLSLGKSAPAGTVVKRDGQVVTDAAFGVALPVDPGEHLLSVQPPGAPAQEQRVSLGKGEKKAITLEVKLAPVVELPGVVKVPVKEVKPSRSYVGPIVAFGVGAVGLGVGAGLGVVVLGKRSELDKACPDQSCPVSEQGNLDGAKALSHASTAALVIGGAAVAVGAVLLLLPVRGGDKGKKVGLRLGAGSLGVEGAF